MPEVSQALSDADALSRLLELCRRLHQTAEGGDSALHGHAAVAHSHLAAAVLSLITARHHALGQYEKQQVERAAAAAAAAAADDATTATALATDPLPVPPPIQQQPSSSSATLLAAGASSTGASPKPHRPPRRRVAAPGRGHCRRQGRGRWRW